MKKNMMMRLASFLLVAVLISTSAISGTYAKYTTQDGGKDEARVAKWGVTARVEGSLFDNAYLNEKVDYEANEEKDSIRVQAYTSADNVVAPGTNNGNGMVFTLTGTPEVDTQITITVNKSKDVVLPKHDDYADYTTGVISGDDTFDLAEAYYPIVYTLKNGANVTLIEGNLEAIKTYLTSLSGLYHTNTNLNEIGKDKGNNVMTDGVYKLSWAWDFDGVRTLNGTTFDATTVDQADTYLGNLAAGIISDAPAGCSTDIEFEISITATQVD